MGGQGARRCLPSARGRPTCARLGTLHSPFGANPSTLAVSRSVLLTTYWVSPNVSQMPGASHALSLASVHPSKTDGTNTALDSLLQIPGYLLIGFRTPPLPESTSLLSAPRPLADTSDARSSTLGSSPGLTRRGSEWLGACRPGLRPPEPYSLWCTAIAGLTGQVLGTVTSRTQPRGTSGLFPARGSTRGPKGRG